MEVAKRGELAQLARASALHAEGQRFESVILHRGITMKGVDSKGNCYNLRANRRVRRSSMTYWRR